MCLLVAPLTVARVSTLSGVRWPEMRRGCVQCTEVPCQLLVASRQDTKPNGCRLSIYTAAKHCGAGSDFIPSVTRLFTVCVARRLTVSKHAAAPSLFRIFTMCLHGITPPVRRTCRGALQVVFVQNNSTERA